MLKLMAVCDGPSCATRRDAIAGEYPEEMIVIRLLGAGGLPHRVSGTYGFCGGACLSEWARRVGK